jgi:hypothetical protein
MQLSIQSSVLDVVSALKKLHQFKIKLFLRNEAFVPRKTQVIHDFVHRRKLVT